MSNVFTVPYGDGSFGLSTAGYVLVAVIIFAALIAIAAIGNRGKHISTKQLTFSAVAIALAFATSFIKVIHMPMGGSVTLFSMLFITLIGYWYGPAVGITAGVAYGLLQLMVDPYIISLPQMLVDYPFAFGALGISGFFSKQKHGMLTGYIAGIIGRYFFAVLSGVIFFGSNAPASMGPVIYSLAYNGAYIGLEGAITIVVMLIPSVSKALGYVKTQAVAG